MSTVPIAVGGKEMSEKNIRDRYYFNFQVHLEDQLRQEGCNSLENYLCPAEHVKVFDRYVTRDGIVWIKLLINVRL